MQALQTKYAGHLFRSRLEARWAVFFDALSIDWRYEDQGFRLEDGTCYLPDFFLPTFNGGLYVEVKPDGGDFSKALKFSCEADYPIWFAEGIPSTRAYLYGNLDKNCHQDQSDLSNYQDLIDSHLEVCAQVKEKWLKRLPITYEDLIQYRKSDWCCLSSGIPNADQATDGDRMFVEPGYEKDDLRIGLNDLDLLGLEYINAVEVSKQARFNLKKGD